MAPTLAVARNVALCALGALAVAGCGSTKTVTVTKTVKPCGEQRIFGHIKSMAPKGNGYTIRFDPAWFLSGETANIAAAEDGVVRPGEPVPNDNYVVDESHRLYTYLVPKTARVTVLTPQHNVDGAPVTVDTLAQLVAGKQPVKLFEPLDTGVWLTVHVDSACAIAQQYHP